MYNFFIQFVSLIPHLWSQVVCIHFLINILSWKKLNTKIILINSKLSKKMPDKKYKICSILYPLFKTKNKNNFFIHRSLYESFLEKRFDPPKGLL